MNPNAILDAAVTRLGAISGLTVKKGLAFTVPTTPMCYVALESIRWPDAGAQVEPARIGFLVRPLVAWADEWETSEEAIIPFVVAIPERLKPPTDLGNSFMDPATLRVDMQENGDGLIRIGGRNYRSAAIRFEVVEDGP